MFLDTTYKIMVDFYSIIIYRTIILLLMPKPGINKSVWERDREFQLCPTDFVFQNRTTLNGAHQYNACGEVYPCRMPLETSMHSNVECSYRSLAAKWICWEGILKINVQLKNVSVEPCLPAYSVNKISQDLSAKWPWS